MIPYWRLTWFESAIDTGRSPVEAKELGQAPAMWLRNTCIQIHFLNDDYNWVEGVNRCTQLQCCGSVTFWYRSGSADLCLWTVDPNPAIFVLDVQDANKLFCFLLFEGTFTSLSMINVIKKSPPNSRNQGFSYFFCLIIEGSRPGSVPLTNGSRFESPTCTAVYCKPEELPEVGVLVQVLPAGARHVVADDVRL